MSRTDRVILAVIVAFAALLNGYGVYLALTSGAYS